MPSVSVIDDTRNAAVFHFDTTERPTVASLKNFFADKKGVDEKHFFLTKCGRCVNGDDFLSDADVFKVNVRLCGGKGGFGSMLRALGAQIEKTTNHEAMRDLSGRRVRDVNNEKALTTWLAKTAERQRQREERRKERMAHKKKQLEEGPRHKFTDDNYHQQKSKVLENLDDAVEAGLKRSIKEKSAENGSGSGAASAAAAAAAGKMTRKRKSDDEEKDSATGKKLFGMENFDEAEVSSSSSSMSSDDEGLEEEKRAILEELKKYAVVDDGDDEEEMKEEHSEPAEVVEGEEEEEEEKDGEIMEGNKVIKKRKKALSEEVKIEASLQSESQALTSSPQVVDKVEPQNSSEPPPTKEGEITEALEISEAPEITETPEKTEAPPSPKPLPPLPLNIDDYSSTGELEEFGLDFLKAALMEIGLKCGGTLEERAARLWSVKGKPKEEWDKSLFAKGKGKGKSSKN